MVTMHYVRLTAKDYREALEQLDENIRGYNGQVTSINLRRPTFDPTPLGENSMWIAYIGTKSETKG